MLDSKKKFYLLTPGPNVIKNVPWIIGSWWSFPA